jgi:hypothetical protein
MTQTPLEEKEAAGTLAAGADVGAGETDIAVEIDPTVGVLREGTDGPEPSESAVLEARIGKASLSARVRQTPRGLWAVAGLTLGVLAATALIVRVSTAPARRRPWATAWALRR